MLSWRGCHLIYLGQAFCIALLRLDLDLHPFEGTNVLAFLLVENAIVQLHLKANHFLGVKLVRLVNEERLEDLPIHIEFPLGGLGLLLSQIFFEPGCDSGPGNLFEFLSGRARKVLDKVVDVNFSYGLNASFWRLNLPNNVLKLFITLVLDLVELVADGAGSLRLAPGTIFRCQAVRRLRKLVPYSSELLGRHCDVQLAAAFHVRPVCFQRSLEPLSIILEQQERP